MEAENSGEVRRVRSLERGYRLADWEVFPADGFLRRAGEEQHLYPLEMKLLNCLASRAGETVSKKELLAAVWNGSAVEEGALPRSISGIRKVLGDDAKNPRYVQTVPKRGYRLIARVEGIEPNESSPARRLGSKGTFLLAAACFAVVALSSWLAARPRNDQQITPALFSNLAATQELESGTNGEECRVAVLPFRNGSGKPRLEWLQTALPELLATDLALSGGVRVVPPEMVARWMRELGLREREAIEEGDLARFRSSFGVNYVLDGSYYLVVVDGSDERIRLDARMRETHDGTVRAAWSESGSEPELFELASLLGSRLRGNLWRADTVPAPVTSELSSFLPRDPLALRMYFEGIERLRSMDAVEARDVLIESLKLEPEQPFGQLALAEALRALGFEKEAAAASAAALNLAEGLPRELRLSVEANHMASTARWPEAVQRYRALWLFSPENKEYGLLLARAQHRAGMPEEALATLEAMEAESNKPADPRIVVQMAEAEIALGTYKRGLRTAGLAVRMGRDLEADSVVAAGRYLEAKALYALMRREEARVVLLDARMRFGAVGDRRAESATLLTEARWYEESGDHSTRTAVLREAASILKEVGDSRSEAETLAEQAIAASNEGRLRTARELFDRASAIARALGDQLLEANVLLGLGEALGRANKPTPAAEALYEAAAIYREAGIKQEEGRALFSLGRVLLLALRHAEAEPALSKAERIFEGLGSIGYLARVLAWRSASAMTSGDLPLAKTLADRAVEMAEQSGSPRVLSRSLLNQARLAVAEGDFSGARRLVANAMALSKELTSPWALLQCYVRLADLEYYAEDLAASQSASDVGLAEARRTDYFVGMIAYKAVRVHTAKGNLDEAERLLAEAPAGDGAGTESDYLASLVRAELSVKKGDAEGARASLEKLAEQLTERGEWYMRTEARIALAKLELSQGERTKGRTLLEDVETDSGRRGYFLFANLASRLLAASATAEDPKPERVHHEAAPLRD